MRVDILGAFREEEACIGRLTLTYPCTTIDLQGAEREARYSRAVRRAVLAPSGALLLVACNALTGAADLGVCEGADCTSSGGPNPEAGATDDATTSNPDGGGPDVLPPTCTDGQKACEGRTSATCVGTTWNKTPCAETCLDGACVAWPSCRNAAGSTCSTNETSCCESKPVPGGPFFRRNNNELPAIVSAFELDIYEVTVGRFRAFVEANAGTKLAPPAAGAGAHPKIPGSGWQTTWNKYLPSDASSLKSSLTNGTWTTSPGANETKPITRVPWLVAFAFCAWDGGRLPTFAEWSFAAAAGAEQRVYPWSSPANSTTITASHAAYSCNLDGTPYQCPSSYCDVDNAVPCNVTTCTNLGGSCVYPSCFGCDVSKDIATVGQLGQGAGKYGHFDLAGNVSELLLDATAVKSFEDSLVPTCVDCAAIMGPDPSQASTGGGGNKDYRVYVTGGGWRSSSTELRTTQLSGPRWDDTSDSMGFRCARD